MPEIGQNLLHYSAVHKIGKRGMGEVFRAKDQKPAAKIAAVGQLSWLSILCPLNERKIGAIRNGRHER